MSQEHTWIQRFWTHRPTYPVERRKVKFSRNKWTRLRGETECWTYIVNLTSGTIVTAELSAVRSDRTLPKWKLLGTHFCLEAEWNSGLLNMVVRKRTLEHFQEPYRESNVDLVNCTLVNERTNTDFSRHASAWQWPSHGLPFHFSPFSAIHNLFLSAVQSRCGGGGRMIHCSNNVNCFFDSTVVVISRRPGLGEAQEMMWSRYAENHISVLACVLL